MNLQNKRVLVTGGTGFLGRNIAHALYPLGADVCIPLHAEYDLVERNCVRRLFRETDPQVVIHCAATVGGIGFNKAKPGESFYDNAMMGINLMDEAKRHGVEKYLQIGTVCSYPKYSPIPFKESDLWSGYPEETNAPYGVAKRALITMADAYRKQYGLNVVTLVLVNLYGPGDHFESDKSHAIPAIIRKFYEAKERGADTAVLWGTGHATREFLYVEDAAEGVVRAIQFYEGDQPVNIGSGESISIFELASMIADKMQYYGKIKFDPLMPDGQPKRQLDVSKANDLFGFTATTSLSKGLDNTIEWFNECAKYL